MCCIPNMKLKEDCRESMQSWEPLIYRLTEIRAVDVAAEVYRRNNEAKDVVQ